MVSNIEYIPKILDFFETNKTADIYVIGGGRGKGATWGIGNELIIASFESKEFILCTREIKDSVDHSSRRTIERLITRAGLQDFFEFKKYETVNKITGSIFVYTGLSKITEDNFQGIEGITRAWLGEAHTMEQSTWYKFEPTIRENNSKIYIDYNIRDVNTHIHQMFVEDPSSDGWPFEGKKNIEGLAYLFLTYLDNTLIPEKLLKTSERNKEQYSPQDWDWIWLGKIRNSEDKYVVDDSVVKAAMEREIPLSSISDNTPIFVGVDCAHMGGDEIPFYKRKGPKVIDKVIYKLLRTPELIRKLEKFCNYDTSTHIVIDNGHVGAAVADYMEEKGYIVDRIDFGGTKGMIFDKAHSKNLATDMAFNLSEKLKTADIPLDEVLKNQLCQRKWRFVNETGQRIIESKEQFKKHAMHLDGTSSPDRGDALSLCFYERNPAFLPDAIIHQIGDRLERNKRVNKVRL